MIMSNIEIITESVTNIVYILKLHIGVAREGLEPPTRGL